MTSSNRPKHSKRTRTIKHPAISQVVHDRKVVAKIGGPKAVLNALQSIADAFFA